MAVRDADDNTLITMHTHVSPLSTTTVTAKPIVEATSDLKKSFRITLEQGQDGWIVVTSPDIDSLVTQGKTEKEAIDNAREAIDLLLEEDEKKDFNLLAFYKE